jgi:hypothetical protein
MNRVGPEHRLPRRTIAVLVYLLSVCLTIVITVWLAGLVWGWLGTLWSWALD